jgi:hydrogenase maturation protein HypF
MVRAAAGDARREAPAGGDRLIAQRLRCRGAVQGVGFRPAVYRIAVSLGLDGLVRNDADGATIELAGRAEVVGAFLERLRHELPPLASIDEIEIEPLDSLVERGFHVDISTAAPRRHARIPPDALLCGDCRREQSDPDDRRYRHAFNSCTHCGPRFSMSRGLPYDRERTSMDRFPLCPDCAREYTDPTNRRFHAESTCCPACGPQVWLAGPGGSPLAEGDAALARCREALESGAVVAVKGIGGFQLACRADRAEPIERLRLSKQRPTKPLAVMVRDLLHAHRLAWLSKDAEEMLASPRAPIVLAPRRSGGVIEEGIAPGIDDVGLLLPTTPLHEELFRDAPYHALVMTSGNAFDEPIARENGEALERLADFVDLFLLHDREVVRRIDDSVVRSSNRGVFVLRRSRGYTPEPLPLPVRADEPVLALGAHLQNTACLAVGDEAFPSQHVGDLDTEPARAFLHEVCAGMEDFLEVKARVLAVDLHPDYPSRWLGERLAEERGGQLIGLQHHLAHAAAVLGEHHALPSRTGRAAALVLDGTGFGLDERSWGCEWLLLEGDLRWSRLARGSELPLVGGERAVREPWRVVVAALVEQGEDRLLDQLSFAGDVEPAAIAAVRNLVERGEWPRATGAGRVFEAAGALLGVGPCNGWEGECAARLEALAIRAEDDVPAWPEVVANESEYEMPTARLIAAAASRYVDGESPSRVARGFHATFCRLAAQQSARLLPEGVDSIALGGGCLANRLLREGLSAEHAALGIRVLLPRALPPGDGGIAYGQAVLAAAAGARGTLPRFEGGA